MSPRILVWLISSLECPPVFQNIYVYCKIPAFVRPAFVKNGDYAAAGSWD